MDPRNSAVECVKLGGYIFVPFKKQPVHFYYFANSFVFYIVIFAFKWSS